jgi:hypothetical protein
MSRQASDLSTFRVASGWHTCSICMANGLRSQALLASSHTTIFVPGDGIVFIAPGAVDHYIEVHSYLPPADFVDAVFACPDLGSPEYRQALRAANGGVEAPLWHRTQ